MATLYGGLDDKIMTKQIATTPKETKLQKADRLFIEQKNDLADYLESVSFSVREAHNISQLSFAIDSLIEHAQDKFRFMSQTREEIVLGIECGDRVVTKDDNKEGTVTSISNLLNTVYVQIDGEKRERLYSFFKERVGRQDIKYLRVIKK